LRLAELESRLGRGRDGNRRGFEHRRGGGRHQLLSRQTPGRQGREDFRLAHGLPAGSGLEFADEVTLSRALEGRREMPA
jgi:hypothetical protein